VIGITNDLGEPREQNTSIALLATLIFELREVGNKLKTTAGFAVSKMVERQASTKHDV